MNNRLRRITANCLALSILLLSAASSSAQDRLKTMPGYEQYQKMSREIPGSVKTGALIVKWIEGGKAFEYQKEGKELSLRCSLQKFRRGNAGRRRYSTPSTSGSRRRPCARSPVRLSRFSR